MSHVLDAEHCPELPTLLQLIASGAPGWGAAFAKLRGHAELSQKDIARALGLNPATISHWETSTHRPHTNTLRKALMLMVDARCLELVFPGTAQGDDNAAKLQAHGETLARTQAALDALVESSGDEVERSLYRVKREMFGVQFEKALKGDTKAAAFVLAWVERFIEERRKANKPSEWHPENIPFTGQDHARRRAERDERQRDEFSIDSIRKARAEGEHGAASSTTSTSVTAPHESAPRERDVPEPIEEKPTVSCDIPRGEPFVHDGNRDAPRRERQRGSSLGASFGLPLFT
jgi:transcriptional regulator with XRE-family HTH domain